MVIDRWTAGETAQVLIRPERHTGLHFTTKRSPNEHSDAATLCTRLVLGRHLDMPIGGGGDRSPSSVASWRMHAREPRVANSSAGATSKAELVETPVSADVEMALRRYQCLKMMKAGQCGTARAEDRFPGIAPKAMKLVVALGAEDPYDRI